MEYDTIQRRRIEHNGTWHHQTQRNMSQRNIWFNATEYRATQQKTIKCKDIRHNATEHETMQHDKKHNDKTQRNTIECTRMQHNRPCLSEKNISLPKDSLFQFHLYHKMQSIFHKYYETKNISQSTIWQPLVAISQSMSNHAPQWNTRCIIKIITLDFGSFSFAELWVSGHNLFFVYFQEDFQFFPVGNNHAWL